MPKDDLLALFNALDNKDKVRDVYVRAPFGYPGGKGKSLERILPKLPYRSRYVEPFGGSGAVLLARDSSPLEVLNDRYAGVTCFYRVVRDPAKLAQLLERLQLCLHSREEFLWCKETWKTCQDEVERAARWWYMIVTSFGQQGRNFGRDTAGRAQIGPRIKGNLPLFQPLHRRLLAVQIENQDWRQCLKDFDSEDTVFYLDPPYLNSSASIYEHELSRVEHSELLERIFQLRGFVALSGYQNDLYDKHAWSSKYSWQVYAPALAMAFTPTNHKEHLKDVQERSWVTEVLWIKESK